MSIKEELDKNGCYAVDHKYSGYNSYSFYFAKINNFYVVNYHLSTESGYEEDLDSYVSDDFNKIVKYLKEGYNYEIN